MEGRSEMSWVGILAYSTLRKRGELVGYLSYFNVGRVVRLVVGVDGYEMGWTDGWGEMGLILCWNRFGFGCTI